MNNDLIEIEVELATRLTEISPMMAQSALPNTHTLANAVNGVIVADVRHTTMSEQERLTMNLQSEKSSTHNNNNNNTYGRREKK